ncbi:hypothetical protein F5884DRAFT_661425 [Xylogone sp. PMI_703]|nr:hypothetical protein F5884DRAFT_661425 [Xylogone sp. PMI_703]
MSNLTPSEIQEILTSGPPYYSPYAVMGGLPDTKVDEPVTAVFLVIYTLLLSLHFVILFVSLKRARSFVICWYAGTLCFLRIISCALRIAWAHNDLDIRLAIANQVFVTAGVVVIFEANLLIVQSIFRASYPEWYARHRTTIRITCGLYNLSIPLFIVMVVVVIVQFFYTLDANIRRIDRDIQKFVAVWFTVSAFMPVITMVPGIVVPYFGFKVPITVRLGRDRFRRLIGALLFSSTLLTFGAAFRSAVLFEGKFILAPRWYHSRACFYCFNFVIEIIAIGILVGLRIRRPHVETALGSDEPSGEASAEELKTETELEPPIKHERRWTSYILTEEEAFNNQDPATVKPAFIHL